MNQKNKQYSMGKIIKLTENELHSIIKETVIKVIKESQYSDEPFLLSGDYTDSEKKKIEKKQKESEKRKQNAEEKEQKKKAKQKKEENELMDKQRKMGYKGLEFK